MTIHDINEKLPHVVREVACMACLHRWIACAPESVWIKDYECPNCEKVGFVIATGQPLDDAEGLS